MVSGVEEWAEEGEKGSSPLLGPQGLGPSCWNFMRMLIWGADRPPNIFEDCKFITWKVLYNRVRSVEMMR